MSLQTIYIEIAPQDIAYVKFIFESYEEVGILRTIDRHKAVIVLLVMDDFVPVAREILHSLQKEISMSETALPAGSGDDWLMVELANESPK